MLKYRLIFGTLMTAAFIGIVLLNGYFDGYLTRSAAHDKPFRGTLVVILIALVVVPTLFELSKLAGAKGIKILLPISIPASALISTSYYWPFFAFTFDIFILFLALTLMACFLYQRIKYGLSGVLVNCGAACFSIL